MRRASPLIVAAALLLGGGCEWYKSVGRPTPGADVATRPISPRPASELVGYLNRQSDAIQTLEYRRVWMAVKSSQGTNTLNTSQLYCEKPRNLALFGGRIAYSNIITVGSNNQEFWLSTAMPGQPKEHFYCAHSDFSRVAENLPVPFDPDWAFQALGFITYPTDREYSVEVVQKDRELHLSYPATTPQGEQVKVTVVFAADQQDDIRPQVRRHIVQDATGKVVAKAVISAVTRHTLASGMVEVPAQMELSWPQAQSTLELGLDDAIVNAGFSPEKQQKLFVRQAANARNLAEVAARYTPRATWPDDLPPRRGR